MRTHALAAILLLVGSIWSTPCPGGTFQPGGGAPYQAIDAGDVFVATITRVEDEGATNAHPPRVWLKVQEVLQGDPRTIRSPARWSPPFHGFDFGDGSDPELKRWYATPLKGPKVGQKFILGGESWEAAPDDKRPAVYNLFDFVRFPYSDERREQVIADLQLLEAARRAYAAEQAAAAEARERRRRQWRAAMTDEVIDKRTQEADAVAIATISGGATYEIEKMLKSQLRMSTGGTYYVEIPPESYDPRIADILDDRPRVILFLSEKNLIASVSTMHAELIDPYEGIAPADDDAIAAVKASLRMRPPPAPRPVLVISDLGRKSDGLAEAARAHFSVVTSHQFSAHSSNTIVHVRNTIPHARFLVKMERGTDRRVVAERIEPDGGTILYDATWPENEDHSGQFQALLQKLTEAGN